MAKKKKANDDQIWSYYASATPIIPKENGKEVSRILPLDCERCTGVIDWGDYGPSGNDPDNVIADRPTCTCTEWHWNGDFWTTSDRKSSWEKTARLMAETLTARPPWKGTDPEEIIKIFYKEATRYD